MKIDILEEKIRAYNGQLRTGDLFRMMPRTTTMRKFKECFRWLLNNKRIIFDEKDRVIWIYYPDVYEALMKHGFSKVFPQKKLKASRGSQGAKK